LPTPDPAAAEGRLGPAFAALGDPTRRRLVQRLAREPGEATPTALAAGLPITRQAVSKHLGILADAGLVRRERSGRESRYRLEPRALAEVERWIGDVGEAWDRRLDRLKGILEG
jgi:DNA-binding transcriptional ArsR family regulator